MIQGSQQKNSCCAWVLGFSKAFLAPLGKGRERVMAGTVANSFHAAEGGEGQRQDIPV